MSTSRQGLTLKQGDIHAGCGADSVSEEEWKTWQCIYPTYIDKLSSLKEGRRITACKAVENPILPEIIEVLTQLNIPYIIENKAYSRQWMSRGRIRVNLHGEIDASINTKLKLMHKLGAEIPKLKSRAERLAKEAVKRKQLEERVSESSPQTTAPKKASKGKKRQ